MNTITNTTHVKQRLVTLKVLIELPEDEEFSEFCLDYRMPGHDTTRTDPRTNGESLYGFRNIKYAEVVDDGRRGA
jgi:hypothetical protein